MGCSQPPFLRQPTFTPQSVSILIRFSIEFLTLEMTCFWYSFPNKLCLHFHYKNNTYMILYTYMHICHSPDTAETPALVLGAQEANNDTNSGLCWAAMGQLFSEESI
jgi:hypothetical protein